MIKISNIKIPAAAEQDVKTAAAAVLGIAPGAVQSLQILKRSIDARHKSGVQFVYTVAVTTDGEAALAAEQYTPPAEYKFSHRPTGDSTAVIAGMGPAGLFAALCLVDAGVKCTVLERGRDVDTRAQDIAKFWQTGALDASSNVQFGEGGAGTFSDGKLTTGTNDARIPFVLRSFVRFGAPEDIMYLAKPHIGTDKLRGVVKSMREYLLERGCDIRFGHRLADIDVADGKLHGISVDGGGETYQIAARNLILAPGNSARDTFAMLYKRGVSLAPKSFSVGVRIEHRQRDIDMAQYGKGSRGLPAADYKLAVHLDSGRTVYTFCVCPGGQVVAAASEPGGVVTNGMSEYARGGESCNGGLLVSVTPEDFGAEPLAGVRFQTKLERAAFEAGGGDYYAPAQTVGDFMARKPSKKHGAVKPSYRPGVKYTNLWAVLPKFVCEAIFKALPELDKRVRGFASPDAVLTAVETRSSCPVRIVREDYEAVGISGLYPCGEGAGYAGGIVSAAVDGIRCAEALCAKL